MTSDDDDARSPASVGSSPLSEDDRVELARLREQVAGRSERRHDALRWTGVAVLLILTGVLVLGSVMARFTRSEVFDTDRYVDTVAPLAADPVIQNELADRITEAIVTRVDIKALTADAVTALSENVGQLSDRPRITAALNSLPALVATQAEDYIHRTAMALVTSDEFADAWDAVNRRAHDALVHAVDGHNRPGIEVADDGTVSISLQPIVATVRERLDARGFTAADRIPDLDAHVVLFHATELPKYQRWLRALDRSANVLPWLVLVTGGGVVWLAPGGRRLRAFALVGVTGVVAMVLLAVGIVVGRSVYLDSVPPDTLSPPAAAVLFDTVLDPLRLALRAVAVLSLVVAMIGYLAGPSRSAGSVRTGVERLLGTVRRRRSGPPNAVEVFVARYRAPLRLVVFAGAGLALMFWSYPTGLVVVGIVMVAGALLLVVEILARPAPTGQYSPVR